MDPIIDEKPVYFCLTIGETTDTMAALYCRAKIKAKITIAGEVNVLGSTSLREAEATIYTLCAGL